MTELPYWRILAIQVAAHGPYASVGRCFYCGTDQPLASFQPGPFSYRVACCRRCRESRTGVPDTRGLIQGTATISRPPELSTPVPIRGLIPSTTSPAGPQSCVDWLAAARIDAAAPPEIHVNPKDAAALGVDVDYIFAPWGSNADELPEIAGDRSGIDAELLALTDLDAQLDAMIAALDARREAGESEAFEGIVTTSTPTAGDAPPLTIDTIRELQKEMEGKAGAVDRIIVGFPGCPFDEALKWERRRILFVGRGVLDALARAAEGTAPYLTKVAPDCEWSILGRKVENWAECEDREELVRSFVADLAR